MPAEVAPSERRIRRVQSKAPRDTHCAWESRRWFSILRIWTCWRQSMPETRIADSATTSKALMIATPFWVFWLFLLAPKEHTPTRRKDKKENFTSLSDEKNASNRPRQRLSPDTHLKPRHRPRQRRTPKLGHLKIIVRLRNGALHITHLRRPPHLRHVDLSKNSPHTAHQRHATPSLAFAAAQRPSQLAHIPQRRRRIPNHTP